MVLPRHPCFPILLYLPVAACSTRVHLFAHSCCTLSRVHMNGYSSSSNSSVLLIGVLTVAVTGIKNGITNYALVLRTTCEGHGLDKTDSVSPSLWTNKNFFLNFEVLVLMFIFWTTFQFVPHHFTSLPSHSHPPSSLPSPLLPPPPMPGRGSCESCHRVLGLAHPPSASRLLLQTRSAPQKLQK